MGKASASALWRCAAISQTCTNLEIFDADFSQAKVETSGPNGNFGAVLFVEKEGFDPLLKKAKIADKFDIAIMSTKGMSVTAARELADKMCHDHDIPLLLLHDFDKAGFSIAGTLQRDTRRYEFQNSITTVDLGLNLEDVRTMTLESEYQRHKKGDKAALMANLRKNGASDEEIAFMFRDFDRLRSTRRVELNAMTSPQFIAFVERKLGANGVAKIIPNQELLAEMYVGFEKGRRLQKAVEEALDDIDDDLPQSALPKMPGCSGQAMAHRTPGQVVAGAVPITSCSRCRRRSPTSPARTRRWSMSLVQGLSRDHAHDCR